MKSAGIFPENHQPMGWAQLIIAGDSKMRLAIPAALCVVMMTGCATVHETYAADGRKAYSLNCSGAARGWDKCYAAAGEMCKEAGYDILDRTGEDSSSTVVVGSANSNSASIGGGSFHTQERSMVIACKKVP
ncbi:hypothetical protein [Chromobacterium sp. IIBBL 290-4]|uniref:hypothetical protein n=1 Tax=Chromobacterium sp. IIBBL 290-4 TaxID=2953890 RepID=UPI0020B69678|nr:hypothetical protein [Chromobacterium sp. IIBBL 290-4]UTH73190.1 hypothetical protein NKT35_16855 [Chromobacterium sp. IIBBL 290-4]